MAGCSIAYDQFKTNAATCLTSADVAESRSIMLLHARPTMHFLPLNDSGNDHLAPISRPSTEFAHLNHRSMFPATELPLIDSGLRDEFMLPFKEKKLNRPLVPSRSGSCNNGSLKERCVLGCLRPARSIAQFTSVSAASGFGERQIARRVCLKIGEPFV